MLAGVERRHDDDRDGRDVEVGLGLDLLEDGPAVDPRHHDVEHHHVGWLRAHALERLLSVTRGQHAVAVELEVDLQERDDVSVIVDDKNRCHLHARRYR